MIIEIITFVAQTMNGIINAFDSVYFGDYSILDIFLSILCLKITLWGLFSLISHKNENNGSVE